jgi:hypothetical protein
MRDPLNFFEPFESLPAGHENQLTRAFLVVLRLVPLAHAVWLRMASDSRPSGADRLPSLDQLPPATFDTQTGTVGVTPVAEEGRDETSAYRAISVLQAGEPPPGDAPAKGSGRRAVFDGVVRYGDDLVIVIESKLDGRFDSRQANEIAIGETAWRVDPHVANLRWRDIIASWRDLLARNLVAGAERGVLEDFLWVVQRNFPRLQPFSELGVCRGDAYLGSLRAKAILEEVGGRPAESRPQGAFLPVEGGRSVKRAFLGSDDWESTIELMMWPGDTLEQAKDLYAEPLHLERLLELRSLGWSVRPNFHFGHMSTGFVWTSTEMAVDDYAAHWIAEIGSTRQVPREEWGGYFDELIRLRIASDANREEFDRAFTNTQRMSATPRPGIRVERTWPFGFAAGLDSKRRFVGEVRDSINTVLGALGELEIHT